MHNEMVPAASRYMHEGVRHNFGFEARRGENTKVRGGAVKDRHCNYCRGIDSGIDLNVASEWPLVLMVTFGCRQGRTL